VLLVACILLALPRGVSRTSFIRRLAPDTFSKRAEQMKDSIPAGQGHDVFCVVFDAGSTGAPRADPPQLPRPLPLPWLGARGPPPLRARGAPAPAGGTRQRTVSCPNLEAAAACRRRYGALPAAPAAARPRL